MEQTKLVLLSYIINIILYFRTNLLSESRETMHSAAIEQLYKTLLQRLEVEKG